MKKFTNISGAKVGQEPKEVDLNKEEVELNEFKHSILKLMDDFLSIRSYGVARPEIMIPTRIVGKEMFVEALTDLLAKKSNKETIKTLESLKSINSDWKSIDDKIESIESSNSNIKEEKKIYDIIEKYGKDEDNLKNYIHSKNLSIDEALEKQQLVEKMFSKTSNPVFKTLSKIYSEVNK